MSIEWKKEFFEADCLVDTLGGLIDLAIDSMQRDIGASGRNRALKILEEAVQRIKEYSKDSPMKGEESWYAPQDPGHRRTAKWGFYK